MHLVLCEGGSLRVRLAPERGKRGAPGESRWQRAAGVLTAPDVRHEIDADGAQVLLVFVDPESDVGEALRAILTAPFRILTADERDSLIPGADPMALMQTGGAAWIGRVVATLGAAAPPARAPSHPRVRRVLRHLRALPPEGDVSLPALAAVAGLSPGRLMHVFTASIGLPLRPYLSWLRLQRAAGAITAGVPLAEAAVTAGFADTAHMTRTFVRMLGATPGSLRGSRRNPSRSLARPR
jgi:AraC-like DNA-binding protein